LIGGVDREGRVNHGLPKAAGLCYHLFHETDEKSIIGSGLLLPGNAGGIGGDLAVLD